MKSAKQLPLSLRPDIFSRVPWKDASSLPDMYFL